MAKKRKASVKRPRGRPSLYTDELAAAICERIARGETLAQIEREADMPSAQTIRIWCRDNADFRSQYTRAREEQADAFADEIVDAARAASDGESAAVARVRVDALKWIAAKRQPKKYGDSTKLEVSGELNVKRVVLQGPKPPGT